MTTRATVVPHTPVLLEEVLRHLITDRSGVYVDGTFGMGGHSRALAEKLQAQAVIIGIDQDGSALKTFDTTRYSTPIHLIHDNFEHLTQILEDLDVDGINGLLLDLGLNSFSLDDPERGFSFRRDGPLDMRFNQQADIPTAASLLRRIPERELADILFQFGEERRSRQIARAIVQRREISPIETSLQLVDVIRTCTPPDHRIKTHARVFQALRIAVNRELEVLESVLQQGFDALVAGGRMGIISYHSLEDRMVKRFFRRLAEDVPLQPGMLPEEERIPRLKRITRKPIRASEKEMEQNPRARSALLRVAERLADAA